MPYCANCGKELAEDARFCQRCGTPVASAQVNTQGLVEKIEVDYPQGDSTRLEIMVSAAGKIEVGPGAGKFVEGTIEYDIPEWRPWITTTGGTVRIEQRQEPLTYIHTNPFNRWNLKVGDAKPFDLDVRAGVGRATWNLGGLPITTILLETGAGVNRVSFKKRNPSVMRNLEVQAGAGELSIEGLLDANMEQMKVRGAVGSIDLNFSGEKLQRDAHVNVSSGVGAVTVAIREGVPARASIRGLSGVRAWGSFYRSGGGFGDSEYRTEAYNTASGPKIELTLDLGVGGVTLSTAP